MLFKKQLEYVDAIQSGNHMFLLYGGAVSGGKSIVTIGYVDEMAQRYPGTRWVIIRKTISVIKRTTIPSYRKILQMNGDPKRAKINKTDWVAQYKNGSEILFMDGDISIDPDLNKLKGLEVTGAVLEEANEVDTEVFEVLKTRVGRWLNKEYGIKPFILFTCNPANNWVKWLFYDPYVAGTLDPDFFFIQALPEDNPHNTEDYFKLLDSLPYAENQRYAKGNWEFGDDPNQLIEYISFKACIVEELLSVRKPKYLGIDAAREGNDKTVLCYMDDENILWFEEFSKRKGDYMANIVEERIAVYNIPQENVVCDEIGVGGGIMDCLALKKIYITGFKSSNTAKTTFSIMTFANRRAEAYWWFKDDIEKLRISYNADAEFQRQSLSIRFFSTDRCIRIESKDDLKKRLKLSPDRLESAIMCNLLRRDLIEGRIMNMSVIDRAIKQVMLTGTPERKRSFVHDMVY